VSDEAMLLNQLWMRLKNNSLILAGILGAFTLFGAGYFATYSSSYDQCQVNHAANDVNYDSPFERSYTFIICEGVTIGANGELITAIATVVMAIFTGTLWFVTGKAVDLARAEFHASHRPRLVVREVDIFWVMNNTTISFVIINEGDSSAHNIDCEFEIRERLMGFSSARHKIVFEPDVLPRTLDPGRSAFCKGKCSLNMPSVLSDFNIDIVPNPLPRTIEFEGWATYSGITNLSRRSAYYRPYDIRAIRFRPSDDPEKEYSG
jgi:hypothetical protein